jgi:hypothetical protein
VTVTLIALLKRRTGMTVPEFRSYYEEHHRKVGEKVLGTYATRYVRRYLTPLDGAEHESDADVITEMDFPDLAARDACFAAMAQPDLLAWVQADEDRLFERVRIRLFDVEECCSQV